MGIVLVHSACSDNSVAITNYSYVCDNGTPTDGVTNIAADITKCVGCNTGYSLVGDICVDDNGLPMEFISVSFTGDDTEMQQISTEAPIDELRTILLTVDPGQSDLSSLYFQFTNTNETVSSVPNVRLSSGADNIQTTNRSSASAHPYAHNYTQYGAHASSESSIPLPIHIPALPQSIPSPIAASTQSFTSTPFDTTAESSFAISASSTTLGDSRSFNLYQIGESAALYARAIRTIGEWSVITWVHPDVYEGCSSDSCLIRLLAQSDVDAITDVFFKDGSDNDIFDWVTSVIGDPWGDHDYDGDIIDEDNGISEPNQLISGDTRTINIILTDIDRAGYKTPAIVGYFAPSDVSLSPSKNNALTLFLHAPWAKFNTSNPKRQDGFYYYFLSALAHEFQHLVHYYQRRILLGIQDPTWLNEQYSLIIEDIVSQNIIGTNTNGVDDRGVNGLSAGAYPICSGRLPDFAEQSYYGISRWGYTKSDNEPLVNYAVNYSFGNFLLRNYNGVAYLVNSYNHNGNPIASIEAGLGGDTLADAVVKWGTSILLSDSADAPTGYRVNNGTSGFSYTHDGVSYAFGSTNYYNYGVVLSAGGCNAHNASGALRVSNDTERLRQYLDNEQHGHSNILYEAGTDVSGTVKFVIALPVGSKLSVIARNQTHKHNPVYF